MLAVEGRQDHGSGRVRPQNPILLPDTIWLSPVGTSGHSLLALPNGARLPVSHENQSK